ncbi:uncharacterized protein [Ptychodera flava]|uniref:uncharacterized protein n=1 Tax=Ptychodera flava TaxID=63121 RepID=UPI00396A6468
MHNYIRMMANMILSLSFKISLMAFVLITIKCLPEVVGVNINSNCTLTRCPPGYKFAGCERESGSNDEECQVCEDGTYSQYHSYSPRCQTCSVCSTDEIRVHPCSRTRNTLCRRKTSKFFVRIAEQFPLTQEDEQQGEDSFNEGSGSEVYFDDDEDNVGISNRRANTSFHGSHNVDGYIVDSYNSTAAGEDTDNGGGGGAQYGNKKGILKEGKQEDYREENDGVQYSDDGLRAHVQNHRTIFYDSAGDTEVAGDRGKY